MPRPALPALFAALLLAAPLAGCGEEVKFAPVCPELSLLADGADLVRFAGAGRDVTDRVLEARVTGVEAACRSGRRGELVATLKLQAVVARGPAATGREAEVPYFVAVTRGGEVVDRRGFALAARFAANVDALRVVGEEVELRFPAGAADYRVYVSLQLTEDELAFNRRQAR